jgi:hypothetical protein
MSFSFSFICSASFSSPLPLPLPSLVELLGHALHFLPQGGLLGGQLGQLLAHARGGAARVLLPGFFAGLPPLFQRLLHFLQLLGERFLLGLDALHLFTVPHCRCR